MKATLYNPFPKRYNGAGKDTSVLFQGMGFEASLAPGGLPAPRTAGTAPPTLSLALGVPLSPAASEPPACL